MKIKVLNSCFTPRFNRSWTAGETVEVTSEQGRQLLQNNNFVEVFKNQDDIKDNAIDNRKKR